jgi:hypothetical protein
MCASKITPPLQCEPAPVDNGCWRFPTTAPLGDSRLAAGATDADRVLAGDAKFGPHELGTDVIPRSVTSQALLNGRFRTRRYAHTMGRW